MRWSLSKEHRDFFLKNQYIEFERFWSPEFCSDWAAREDTLLQQKLAASDPGTTLDRRIFEDLFRAGRDLWRDDGLIRKGALDHSLAHLAAELFQKRSIRLGYTQALRQAGQPAPPLSPALAKMLTSNLSLRQCCCLQDVIGCVAVCLREPDEPVAAPLPSQAGHVSFFTTGFPLQWGEFAKRGRGHWSLIVYADPVALYLHREEDPHLHFLKSLGYVFGDRLNERLHPTLLR